MLEGTDWRPFPGTQWPNQTPIVDGVTPVDQVSQDPYLFADTTDSLMEEMGV